MQPEAGMIGESPGDLAMPASSRPVRILSLVGLGLTGALVLGHCGPARAQSVSVTPPSGKALLADFVEITSRAALRRDAALIDLVNMSDIVLDVHIGEGATSLKPGERMLAGVQPGRVAVKVIGQDVPTGALEGDLEIEGGRHYELAFAYDLPPTMPTESTMGASPGGDAAATSADAAADEPAPLKATPASSSGKPAKSGKVGVGRRRP